METDIISKGTFSFISHWSLLFICSHLQRSWPLWAGLIHTLRSFMFGLSLSPHSTLYFYNIIISVKYERRRSIHVAWIPYHVGACWPNFKNVRCCLLHAGYCMQTRWTGVWELTTPFPGVAFNQWFTCVEVYLILHPLLGYFWGLFQSSL